MLDQADHILEMKDIVKEFPGVRALDGVSLSVERGEIHAICGENGAGKSTLMKVLSGVHPHGSYKGEILYEGKPVSFSNIRDSESAGIVIIHQELALIPELSITENIFLGNEVRGRGGIDWLTARKRAKDLMDRVGLNDDPDSRIKSLGVGKQQLVEIAKAISKNVKLLILDEPTAALNESDSSHLLDLIREFKSHGMTCIMISHKLNEIAAIADSITIIRDGHSVETINVPEGERVDEDRLIRGMVGRPLTSRYPDHTSKPGEVLLEVKDWTIRHPEVSERLVCKGSTFQIRRGEIVGFAGLMGAGRTELARSLFGRSYGRYVKGTMLLHGKEVAPKNVEQAIDMGLAYVTEDRKVLGLNLLDAIRTTVVSADLQRISPRGVVDRNAEHVAAEKYRRRAAHQDAQRQRGRGEAVRRQPAEGRRREVAVHPARAADPRRTHARHRRGRQVRDVRDHERPRRPGQGDHDDLLRAPRAPRHLRPHLHGQRRHHHRLRRRQGGHARGPDASHDPRSHQHDHCRVTRES